MNKDVRKIFLTILLASPFCAIVLIDEFRKEKNKENFPIIYTPLSEKLDPEFNDYSYPFMENCFLHKPFAKENNEMIKYCAEQYINLGNQLSEQKIRNIEFSKANLNYYPIRK